LIRRLHAASYLLPGFCLLLYGTLAFRGLHYGLPNVHHALSYNCDETTWLEALSRIKTEQRLNPHPQLAHPTFYLGIYGAALGTAGLLGWVPLHADKERLRQNPGLFARFYLVGRYLQILFGILLIASFWGVVRALWGPLAAGISTLLLSVTPAFIAASHFSQASLPVTALSFWSLACVLWDVRQNPSHRRWLYLGAFLGGLAISTKYSAFPIAPVLLYRAFQRTPRGRSLAETALVLAAGFFIGSPFALLAPQSFWAGFIHHSTENLEPVGGLWRKWLFPWTYSFRYALGGVAEIACIAAGLWHLYQKRFNTALVLWTAGLFAGILTVGYVATPGRVLIGIPVLLIGTGVMLADLARHGGAGRAAAYVLTAIIGAASLLPSLSIVDLRRQKPVQEQASEWIQTHIPRDRTIALPRSIYWWTPDVLYQSMAWPERMASPYKMVNLEFSIDTALKTRPDFILISDYEKYHCSLWPQSAPRCGEFIQWLDEGTMYAPARRFSRQVRWKGWRWDRPEGSLAFDDDLWTTSLTLYQRL
jgi:MFS family permease